MEELIRGLNTASLRRLASPTSLEQALAHAERVEAMLKEGESGIGVQCKAFVDTSSTISIVQPGVLPHMHVGQRDSPHQGPPPTITGQIVPMMGRRCLKIKLWLAKIKNGCILGLDLLTKVRAMLDLARGTMHLSRDRLLLTPFPEKEGELQDRGNTGVSS
ncbi:UNVERIFIED_CONTAM: hypothetical protein FKN15_058994 [Acipenser sinensis]